MVRATARARQVRRAPWTESARNNQLPPAGDWRTWLILAGRGWGKTRTGAEWVLENARNGVRRAALVGATASDVRDVMVEGESGILACAQQDERPTYEPSKRRLTFPSGAVCTTYTADEPNRLRGPQHEVAWADELAAWRYGQEAWDTLMLGLRIGKNPRVLATTTPKPVGLLRDLVEADNTAVTRGNTYENRDNLAGAFFEQIVSQYEGTRLGRQEIYAELLSDVPGALWRRDWIDATRQTSFPDLVRVVVAVDPAATSGDSADETGIIAAGAGDDSRGYVLADYSVRATPDGWAREAVAAYHKHEADCIVAEANQGGEMVGYTLETVDASVPVRLVRASRGKQTRAEPVAAIYEQGRISHVGLFAELEDQLCSWTPGDKSPDRLDALVWAFSELAITQNDFVIFSA